MAAKKKTVPDKPTEMKKYAYTKDGMRHEVLAEDGKYLYCAGITLRHTNPDIEYICEEER